MDGMVPWKRDPIGTAKRGENPTLILPMRSGFALMGYTQFLPGYCLLWALPEVTHLTDMSHQGRRDFLFDMALLGEAIETVCGPRRMNYEILGNSTPVVHAHLYPRYEWEAPEYREYPVSRYPAALLLNEKDQFSEVTHGQLKTRIAATLRDLMRQASVAVDDDNLSRVTRASI